jgi:phytoene dehydrogenase-like protein
MTRERVDVVVVGAGHNGLVAALELARAGLTVRVYEEQAVIGGACRTETPFAKVPGLKHSTGAYLLGLMPPELLHRLGVKLPLLRRDPHYFLPTTGNGYALFGSDREALAEQMRKFFSERDLAAHTRMNEELGMLRDDLAPAWLEEPLSVEDTAERFIRPALRKAFVELVRGSIGDYLARFSFESPLVQAMYAVTDAFSGLSGGWDTPGTGHNFLVHNMCRLPGSDGTWMIVEGGMGTVTRTFAEAAQRASARIELSTGVAAIRTRNAQVEGVRLQDGREVDASYVVVNADPFRLRELVGSAALDPALNARIDGFQRPGTTLKLNLALSALPRFTCLPEERGQHRTTTHLLPQEGDIIAAIKQAHADALAGKLPDFPAIEWYFHTTVDPSLQDDEGHHSSALFVQWAPNRVAGSSWDREADRYADHLLDICERFAPGTKALVKDRMMLHPEAIEQRFGIRHGHIHHVDNGFAFADRMPYRTSVAGLYSASAGCHPAGSVIGAAGHNAARALLADR